ncbi:PEGA domain-containing protein, partial [Candidatus Bipolaricaulota bacterium]|nr:PEGA domain-containing protein [Candidatus Bipolaricaulota bacterium]
MKHLTALLLAVIWLVLATTGIALGQSRPQGIVVSPAKPSLSIELRLSKECLSPRERLTLKFTLDRAAYVYIYNIDSKGKVWLLFPNGFSRNPWVSKGEHTLPDSNEYSIVIEGPPGVEYIQAIASLRPIPLFQHDSTRNKAFLFLSADPKAFAAKLDTWLKKNLPQGSWATDWAEYGVSLGRLIITSWPPDAKIYVDDKYRGTTQPEEEAKVAKMELWLPTGYHRISVTKEGFRSRSQTIHLKPCKTKSLVFWLEEPGRVSISSFPRGATIYIDGRSLGATPKEFDVGSGKHTIELYKPGYKLWTRDLYLSPGERKDLYAKLQVNLSPEGRFKFTPLKPLVGEEVTFDASASYDVD